MLYAVLVRSWMMTLSLCCLMFSCVSAAHNGLFQERVPFCKSNPDACVKNGQSLLPKKQAPKTIIIVHGMQSNLNVLGPTFIHMAQFLESLDTTHPDYHVYGINYHSDNDATVDVPLNKSCNSAGGCHVDLVQLNHHSSTCNNVHTWQHCWQRLIRSQHGGFTATNMTIRHLADAMREVILQAKSQGLIADGPVTLIAHSMGGLVVRDMLYHGEGSKTGYEILKNHGVQINEYISFGTPHQHGLTAVNDSDIRDISCRLVNQHSHKALFQYCMLTHWINEQQDGSAKWQTGDKLEIAKPDFPQIRWIFVAGFGQILPVPDQSGRRPIGDGLVDFSSALYRKDNRMRADDYVLLKETSTPVGYNPEIHLPEFIMQSIIPGKSASTIPPEGCLPSPVGFNGYSCFDEGTDAIHGNIYGVGDPQAANSTESCTIDTHDRFRFMSCFGYFQYVVPKTTLCLLPGFSMSNDYYRRNPHFAPTARGLDMHCRLRD